MSDKFLRPLSPKSLTATPTHSTLGSIQIQDNVPTSTGIHPSSSILKEVPANSNKSNVVTLDDVIKRRLVVDGDGVGDDRKIQGLLKSFMTISSSEDFNKTEDESVFRKLIHQLHQMEYSARRSHAAIKMNEETKAVYNSLDTLIEEETLKTKETIKSAKIVIEEETKHRKHSMEYEALSKLIESKPDRKATELQKRNLEAEVRKLSELKEELVEAVRDRQKQVSSLAFAVETLRQGIQGDEAKPWASVFVAKRPAEVNVTMDIEVEVFPLEKEVFPLKSFSSSSDSKSKPENAVGNGNGGGPNSAAKGKYEDLSEESPEEGESED